MPTVCLVSVQRDRCFVFRAQLCSTDPVCCDGFKTWGAVRWGSEGKPRGEGGTCREATNAVSDLGEESVISDQEPSVRPTVWSPA